MNFSPLSIALLVAACATSPVHAQSNCEALQAEIKAKFAANGVKDFALTTVDADAPVSGKVVGSCAFGTKKVIYQASVEPAPGKAPEERMLTECRDGSVSHGGDCKG